MPSTVNSGVDWMSGANGVKKFLVYSESVPVSNAASPATSTKSFARPVDVWNVRAAAMTDFEADRPVPGSPRNMIRVALGLPVWGAVVNDRPLCSTVEDAETE